METRLAKRTENRKQMQKKRLKRLTHHGDWFFVDRKRYKYTMAIACHGRSWPIRKRKLWSSVTSPGGLRFVCLLKSDVFGSVDS